MSNYGRFNHATLLAIVILVVLACVPTARADFRTIDGSGNNTSNSDWGQAGTRLLRELPAIYPGDGSGETIDPTGRANPRTISNAVFSQTTSVPNSRGLSGGVWQWGQFIDHDIDLTLTDPSNGDATIIAPQPDPFGITMIPTDRSKFERDAGPIAGNPREQINDITSYLDGSNVYGSDATRAAALRTAGGKLKTSAGDLLPLSNQDTALAALPNADGGSGLTMFVAGDVRANEQIGLTSMHTVLMREHNWIVDELAICNPTWDGDQLYNMARKIVGAEIQAITYNDFLPAMLGSYAPSAADYSYNAAVNAGISTEFSTAIFRVGHTMLSADLLMAGDNGASIGTMPLRDAFFRPDKIMADPDLVEQSLMGLAMKMSQEIDANIVDDVRNFLFAPSGGVGLDLASLNIQRGRDHGLDDYNSMRLELGLSAAATFADITSDLDLQTALASVYTDINNVDLWVGALAEDHVAGSSVGELIMTVMVDQFERLRDGDSFFYVGDSDLLESCITSFIDLDTLSFMDILDRQTSLNGMPDSFFIRFVPEPSSWALLAIGGVLVGLSRRRSGPAGSAAVST